MTISEIARTLVDHCRAGAFEDPYDTLFAEDAKSVEGTGEVCEGLATIKVKSEAWGESNTVHSATIHGPFVGADQFAVHFVLEITPKETGEKMTFAEVGVYTVADGKIVEEKFLYGV